MYKVYLSPSTQDKSFGVGAFGTEEFRMNQIADVVENILLGTGEYAVFRNVSGMTKEEIIADSNEVTPFIHVAIHSNYGNKPGCECYVKVGDEVSNGFGKEVYKEVLALYYDKNIDNGLVYDEKIVEINKVISPAILIEVGCHENENDSKWIVSNIEKIGEAIARGIEKGFNLKYC